MVIGTPESESKQSKGSLKNIPPQVLILGIGNTLLSDEGLGVHIINILQNNFKFPPNVTLYDGGTGGLSLLSLIKDKDYLFIIDAVLIGQEPGTIVQFSYDSVQGNYVRKDTAHGIDVFDILAAAYTKDILPKTTIVGIQPGDISTPSLELTPPVSSSVEPLIQTILDQLTHLGIKFIRKTRSLKGSLDFRLPHQSS